MFEFRDMPFGLVNAPATFQRMMDVVMAGLKWTSVLVYLDDIIVYSRTFEEHMRDISWGDDQVARSAAVAETVEVLHGTTRGPLFRVCGEPTRFVSGPSQGPSRERVP